MAADFNVDTPSKRHGADRRLHVGIDVHFCRVTQTGIYTYLWNVIARFEELRDAPALTLLLYGPDGVPEPEPIVRMQQHFSHVGVRNLWTSIPAPRWPWARGAARRSPGILDGLWLRLLVSSSAVGRAARSLFERRAQPRWWSELDVVHHTAGLLLPLHPRVNVMTISDLIPHHYRYQYGWEHQWFGESFSRAHEMDLVLVYSEHTKQDVVQVLGIAAERIRVVPLAAHPQYRVLSADVTRPVLEQHGVDDLPYLLYVGSLEPRKNLVRLVEAFGELVRQDSALPHRLILVGPRFSTYQPIFETIERLGLADRVRWLGVVPFGDLPALMNGAAAFVYPSFYEGFGLPPLEAMACGTPVIAANASSIPEVVGDAGILVDPYRTVELTCAMQRIVSDPSLAAALTTAGLARADRFRWEQTAESTACAYRDAFASATRSAKPTKHAPTGYVTRRYARQWIADRWNGARAASTDTVKQRQRA